MIRQFFILVSFLFLFSSCQESENNSASSDQLPKIDDQAVSLYQLNDRIVDLESMELASSFVAERDFKATGALKANLQKEVYSVYCNDVKCFILNQSNGKVDISPIEGQVSEVQNDEESNSFLLPAPQGCISFFALPESNIMNIQYVSNEGAEIWSTIYEIRKSISDEEQTLRYAKVLGYNEHIIAMTSTEKTIAKSGFIDIATGYKKQENAIWNGLLLDNDFKTVLGSAIKAEKGMALNLGARNVPLPSSSAEYSSAVLMNAGDEVIVACFEPNAADARVYSVNYQTGNLNWDYPILGSLNIKNLLLSAYKEKIVLELQSNSKSILYVFHKSDGQLLQKF